MRIQAQGCTGRYDRMMASPIGLPRSAVSYTSSRTDVAELDGVKQSHNMECARVLPTTLSPIQHIRRNDAPERVYTLEMLVRFALDSAKDILEARIDADKMLFGLFEGECENSGNKLFHIRTFYLRGTRRSCHGYRLGRSCGRSTLRCASSLRRRFGGGGALPLRSAFCCGHYCLFADNRAVHGSCNCCATSSRASDRHPEYVGIDLRCALTGQWRWRELESS